jgi:hypothetical protein
MDNLAAFGSPARLALVAKARAQLIWVDRNQLGRRNLTDEQRAVVMGRLYKAVKLAQGRPPKDEKVDNLSTFSGSAATAKAIAAQVGVNEKTVRRAEKFADVVEALHEVSPQAAERVLRGEVRDAFVANGQNPAAFSRQGGRSRAIFDGGAFVGPRLIVAKCHLSLHHSPLQTQDSTPKREPDGFRKLALAFVAFAAFKMSNRPFQTGLRCQS